jgi:hypothetical protein
MSFWFVSVVPKYLNVATISGGGPPPPPPPPTPPPTQGEWWFFFSLFVLGDPQYLTVATISTLPPPPHTHTHTHFIYFLIMVFLNKCWVSVRNLSNDTSFIRWKVDLMFSLPLICLPWVHSCTHTWLETFIFPSSGSERLVLLCFGVRNACCFL